MAAHQARVDAFRSTRGHQNRTRHYRLYPKLTSLLAKAFKTSQYRLIRAKASRVQSIRTSHLLIKLIKKNGARPEGHGAPHMLGSSRPAAPAVRRPVQRYRNDLPRCSRVSEDLFLCWADVVCWPDADSPACSHRTLDRRPAPRTSRRTKHPQIST
jgi:hypothetical protein